MNAATLNKLEEIREKLSEACKSKKKNKKMESLASFAEEDSREKGAEVLKKVGALADRAKSPLYDLQQGLHKDGYPKLAMRVTKVIGDIEGIMAAIKLGRLS